MSTNKAKFIKRMELQFLHRTILSQILSVEYESWHNLMLQILTQSLNAAEITKHVDKE